MVSVTEELYLLALLSALISVSANLFILSLTQQDTLAQRQQIPGIKYDNSTNTSTTTLSNTTDLPKFGLDSNNNNVSTEPCIMTSCPPGEMCIQVCPETELQ